MDLNLLFETIINEPIYLSIVILLSLVIVYSVLKKFFKLLLIILTVLILYITYLVVTDSELPGESEKIINPIIDNAGEVFEYIGDEFKKIKENLARIPFLRDAVALYFCAVDPETPMSKKTIAFAALAYFIMPIDAIPDAIPIAGFTDDAAMIVGVVAALESVITNEHRDKAEEWLNKLY